MTVVAVLLFVFAVMWLGSAQKRAGGRATVREPDGLPPVPTPQSVPLTARPAAVRDAPAPVGSPAVAVARADSVPRASDTCATSWMLSKRGLCSPDPHP